MDGTLQPLPTAGTPSMQPLRMVRTVRSLWAPGAPIGPAGDCVGAGGTLVRCHWPRRTALAGSAANAPARP